MFSNEVLSLNRIDISDCIYNKNDVVNYSQLFLLAGIKYVNNIKYYMIVPVSYYAGYDKTSNFLSSHINDILLSKRAIDVTESEYLNLVKKDYIFRYDKIDESVYPVVKDGEYDENVIVILSKINLKLGILILFSSGDGRLYLAFQHEITSSKRKFTIVNGTKVVSNSSSYLRINNLVVKNENHNAHIYLLAHLRLDTLEFLNIDDKKYKDLRIVNDLFNVLFKNFSNDVLFDYFKSLTCYMFAKESYNDYDLYNINRLSVCLEKLTMNINFLNGHVLNIGGLIEYYYKYNDNICKISAFSSSANLEGIYGEKDRNGYVCEIVGDVLKIRVLLPSMFKTTTIYYTLCIDFKNSEIYHEDIREYEFGDIHTVVFGNMNLNQYMLSRQVLTDKFDLNVYEDVDFSEQSKINNYSDDIELSVESLSEELTSLGYKKKLRQTLPDYVYMNIAKSAWLNEREFVTLREYKSENKKTFQLDLYKDGKYYATLSGDFKEDAISNLIKSKKSKTKFKSVFNVPKVWADMYHEDRNLVYYPSYLFFMDYSTVYNTLKKARTSLNSGTYYYTCARFNPTGEYCICYCSAFIYRANMYDILLEESEEYNDLKNEKYFRYCSYAHCMILMRFKTEEEMFNAYSEMFRKKDSVYNVYLTNAYLYAFLSLSNYKTPISNNYIEFHDEDYIVENSILKRLGYLDMSWRDIYSKVPDEIFNTMIFD